MVYTTYFRLLNERAIQVKGHQKAIEMLKSGQYANIADDITAKKVIGDTFGVHGVCRFYLTTEPFLTTNYGIIFPVIA